jgi:hypothetical protein
VLIVKQKTIIIARQQVKLYSLDSKLWFSKPHAIEFRRRLAEEKRTCQLQFRRQFTADTLPLATAGD